MSAQALERLKLEHGYLHNTGGNIMCWRADLTDNPEGAFVLISANDGKLDVGLYKDYEDEGVIAYDETEAFVRAICKAAADCRESCCRSKAAADSIRRMCER